MVASASSTPSVRVAVCTYNRSEAAITAVQRVLRLAPDTPVVLVDSGSTGEHRRLLEEFAQAETRIQLERCEKPGVAHARNRAVTAAAAEWVAFIDDDIEVDDGWWEAAKRIAATAPADHGIVGGRILPRWPGAAPEHVGWRWLMFLSCMDEAPTPKAEGLQESYNGNLLLRTEAWSDAAGYPESLGRMGSSLLSGEENELQQAAHRAGWIVTFDHSLLAHHIIPQERLERSWIRRRAYWGGISEVVATRGQHKLPRKLNPAKAVAAMVILRLASSFADEGSDRYIRSHYARGVLVGRLWPRSFT